MTEIKIVYCDPVNNTVRKYVPRIPNRQWKTVKQDVVMLHRSGWRHKDIIAYLKTQGLTPTQSQLGAKMSQWGLFTYRTSKPNRKQLSCLKSILDPAPIPTLALATKQNTISMNRDIGFEIPVESYSPILKCDTPLYAGDERGNLVPNWSAFLTKAAQGDFMAMKTVCILARSQRFSQSHNDYLLYQNVIEAVQAQMASPGMFSLQQSIMVFYAVLALAIQAGVMGGLYMRDSSSQLPRNEAALHLNAAGVMLGYISRSVQQYDGKGLIKRLIDFENVVSYLLAVSGSAAKAPAWPLLMYHLILQ